MYVYSVTRMWSAVLLDNVRLKHIANCQLWRYQVLWSIGPAAPNMRQPQVIILKSYNTCCCSLCYVLYTYLGGLPTVLLQVNEGETNFFLKKLYLHLSTCQKPILWQVKGYMSEIHFVTSEGISSRAFRIRYSPCPSLSVEISGWWVYGRVPL
jgi:hypothetical protein